MTLVLRELSTGKEVRYKLEEPSGPNIPTNTVAFSPDGKVLVVGGSHRIRRLDVARGREIPLRAGEGEHVRATALSPDGRLLASCNWDGAIRLYDTTTGRLLRSLDQPDPHLSSFDRMSLAFTPDGERLIYAGDYENRRTDRVDSIVQVWDVVARRMIRRFSVVEGNSPIPNGLLLSPDGKEVGLQEFRKGVIFYDWKSGARTSRVIVRDAWRAFLALRGRTLALTVLEDYGRLHLWDRVTGRRIHTLMSFDNRPDAKHP
jgi:WD40 repeat protein